MRQVVVLVSWAVLGLCAGQKPCCTPDQWEGTIQGLQGFLVDDKLGTVDGTVQISYDFTNQKLALVENLNETGTGNIMVKVIQDYKKGKQYVIRGKSCMESVLKGFVKQCIPDNATNIGSFSFGGMAPGGLECEAFMTTFAGMDNNYVISDVTREGCYPVTQVTVNLMREHSTMTTQIFTDITPGIKDPSVFTPPEPPCAKNNQVVFEDTSVFGSDFLERALGAFKQVVTKARQDKDIAVSGEFVGMEVRVVRNKVLAVNLLILGSVAGVCSGVGFLVAYDIGSIFSFIAASTALITGILTITENDRLVWLATVAAYFYEAVCLLHTLVFLGLVIGACNSSLYLTTAKGGCSGSKEFTGLYAFNMTLTLMNGVLCALLILNVCGCFTRRTEKTPQKTCPSPQVATDAAVPKTKDLLAKTKTKRTKKSRRPSSYKWPSTPILSPSPRH
ncbi:hypothetical protein Bbelb_366960 [Branchiostoma belcheri]|nr:hypothetical protein Bbelb_366960 [Branchiostoma belcheri]